MNEVKYYDMISKSLVYISNGSNNEYWDKYREYHDLKKKWKK